MLEVTQKAFKNREPIKCQKDKKLTRVIVAALEENLNNETVWHNRPEGDQETSKLPSEKDLCGYCKEKGHWKDECTMEENGPVSTKVRKGTRPSLLHFKPSRVTLKVREKNDGLLSRHWGDIFSFCEPPRPTDRQRIAVLGGERKNDLLFLHTTHSINLGKGTVTNSFLVMTACSSSLFG